MKNQITEYVFLGNNIAIDFINTRVVQQGELVDLLEETDDLRRWANDAEQRLEGTIKAADLVTAKRLRAALSDLLESVIDRSELSLTSLATVNSHLENHAYNELLQFNTVSGELELVPDNSATHLRSMLSGLAYEGAKLLASPQAAHVKRCSNPNCVLLFLDTSRTRKRRWCSMEICGNRAKAAKHYRKQSQ